MATSHAALSPAIADRARAWEAAGLGAFDALHLACAAAGGADALLSTDDRFVHRAARLAADVAVRAVNLVTWLTAEVLPR